MQYFSAQLPLKKNSISSIAIRFADDATEITDENVQIHHEETSLEQQALPEVVEPTASSSSDSTIIEPLESTEVKKSKKTAKHNDTSLGKKESK